MKDGSHLQVREDGPVRALGPAGRVDLACAALAAAPPATMRRGEVRFLSAPDGTRLAWRRYRHGGLFGWLLGERYLSVGRAARELALYRQARARGVPTLEPWAVRAVRRGLFWRLDLVTGAEPDAKDLGTLYDAGLAGAPRALRAAAMAQAGRAVGALFRAGIQHPDLNITNLLACGLGEAPWSGEPPADLRVLVIDFDRAAAVPGKGPVLADAAARMLARLGRSVQKRVFLGRPAPSARDQLRFLRAVVDECAGPEAASRTPLRAWVQRVRQAGRGLWIHRLRWRLERPFARRPRTPPDQSK